MVRTDHIPEASNDMADEELEKQQDDKPHRLNVRQQLLAIALYQPNYTSNS